MMAAWFAPFFLVGGAVICLIAAIGLLQLPDFFMRMHAATKAGVVGCGLVLIGVGFAYPSPVIWMKIAIAIVFLLLTTPVTGHLLARAGYVAGVPLWGGTLRDQLEGELERGQFEWPTAMTKTGWDRHYDRERERGTIARIVVALASGPDTDAAIGHAVALAKTHRAELVGLAIIDTKRLSNVGPVPIGGGYYAAQLRSSLIEKARHALAEAVQRFEQAAGAAGIPFTVAMEEGDPAKILSGQQSPDSLVMVGRRGWFDHGVSDAGIEPLPHLVRRGIWPLIGVSGAPSEVRRISFVHDGSRHSDRTWKWLLMLDPWPQAAVRLMPDDNAAQDDLREARAIAHGLRRSFEEERGVATAGRIAASQVVIFGNEGHAGWINRARMAARPRLDEVPIVIFG
ncbi:monovalent cation/H(+) antiporter subunit G [Microvirga massiliensis]|uniref:monovalent cation/H(+) antiporter subunit G n=1 Tax=Microvirga massiliensis TaxID=1033741 RepID=UPI0009E635D1|nr:monovalent cation/H(+) antiporter subunit G [Microvirga massiliensis]